MVGPWLTKAAKWICTGFPCSKINDRGDKLVVSLRLSGVLDNPGVVLVRLQYCCRRQL